MDKIVTVRGHWRKNSKTGNSVWVHKHTRRNKSRVLGKNVGVSHRRGEVRQGKKIRSMDTKSGMIVEYNGQDYLVITDWSPPGMAGTVLVDMSDPPEKIISLGPLVEVTYKGQSMAVSFDKRVKMVERIHHRHYNDVERWNREQEAAFEDEGGYISPKRVNYVWGLMTKYIDNRFPREAMYVRAKDYTYSDNLYKYSAGKKAMRMIKAGKPLSEVREILENWLPEDRMWD